MKNVSFGKEEDFPIPKKKDEDLSDDNDLDLEDENVQNEKDNNNQKSNNNNNSPKQYEEYELSPNDPKNKKVIFSSQSEDEDSDKTSEENDSNKKERNKNSSKNNNRHKGKKSSKKVNNIEENEENNNKKVKKNKKEESSDEDNDNKEKEDIKIKKENDDNEEDSKNLRSKKKFKNEKDEEFEKEKLKNKEIEIRLLQSIKNKENATSERIHLAEEINFKSLPDTIITTDQYGFIVSNNKNEETNNNTKEDLLQINARIEKWNYMIEHFDEFLKNKLGKLKSRTRKGIPDCLRSYVWQIFGEKDKFYQKDIFKKLESVPIQEDIDIVIIKDLDRTFPACQFFKDKYGNGQRKLYKVLSNYSKFNTDTGYVQGMGFLVAVFLTYMDEESSFFMLDSLMKKYGLDGYYKPNFPKLKSTFYVFLNLLKKFIPKIYDLFKKEGMIPSMYASEWFICLYSRNLEFNALVRIFDIFLLEGFKVIYRFALAFLKLKEDKFLEGKDGLASIMQTMNECYIIDDIEKLIKIAFGFSLSRKYINKLEIEYESIKGDPNNEFVKQL